MPVGTITKIEDQDFLHGSVSDCRRCPVALALNRNGYHGAVVTHDIIAYYKDREEISKPITKGVRRKIESIDNQNQINPFMIIEREDRFSLYKGKQNA
ncbi:hypothetical protein F4Z99_11530 [Candidatus Poribacteria bacterium]|nr:hypothetical protein [Candidatus Poribacteria bacterium]